MDLIYPIIKHCRDLALYSTACTAPIPASRCLCVRGRAVQALLIGPVARKVDEATAEYVCCWGMLFSFTALSGATRLWHLLALLIPLSAAGQLNNTLNTARLTKVRGAWVCDRHMQYGNR